MMILIKGGTFLMGSPENEEGRYDDERQRQVEVADFYLSQFPVTNAEYRCFDPDHNSSAGFNGDDQPVVNVSWRDAVAYTDWLSRETGEDYRLPSEEEWEYACRAGTTTSYYFGDDPADLGEYAWYWSNANRQSRPVGQKKPNPWGLYDMLGNVWERTSSFYDGDAKRCVLRGGSWNNIPRSVRSAGRYWVDTTFRDIYFGFRLARTVRP